MASAIPLRANFDGPALRGLANQVFNCRREVREGRLGDRGGYYPGKIVSTLRRALRYPAEARRQRLSGEAHVQFTVTSNGGVASVRLVKSSGSPVLDQAAIETVQRAAPFPAIPPEAGRTNWPFTVPLAFSR